MTIQLLRQKRPSCSLFSLSLFVALLYPFRDLFLGWLLCGSAVSRWVGAFSRQTVALLHVAILRCEALTHQLIHGDLADPEGVGTELIPDVINGHSSLVYSCMVVDLQTACDRPSLNLNFMRFIVGIDFVVQTYNVDNYRIQLQIW